MNAKAETAVKILITVMLVLIIPMGVSTYFNNTQFMAIMLILVVACGITSVIIVMWSD